MWNKLRKILLSVPVVTAVCVFALYVGFGFLALPAIVKWQVEKQVPAKLGHTIQVDKVRFNPFLFKFEVDGLVLSDMENRPLLSFQRLLVDFELRSVLDRAWTFAQVTLEVPVLNIALGENGRHNFSALLDRLRGDKPDEQAGVLPRLVMSRVVLADGRIEYSDRILDEPLIARIEPLQIEIDRLSTLPAGEAHYQLSARTVAGEMLETSGSLTVNPARAKGKLVLGAIKAGTLARGLSRLLALESPAGQLDVAANYDLAVDANGKLSGAARDINLNVAALSFTAPNGGAPLVAAETLSFKQGRVDLTERDAAITELRLTKGSLTASMDKAGRTDWARLVRASSPPPQETTVPAADQASTAPKPWRVSVARGVVSDIAVRYSDAGREQSGEIAALKLEMSANAEVGGAQGARVELGKPRLSMTAARLARGSDTLRVPGAIIEAGRAVFGAGQGGIELTLDTPRVAAPDGITAGQGNASLEVRAAEVSSGRVTLNGADAAVKGAIDDPKVALSGVSMNGSGESLRLREVAFEGARIGVESGLERFDLGIEKPRSTLAGLLIKQDASNVEFGIATIAGENISVAQADGRVQLNGSGAQVSVSGLSARRAADQLAVKDASFNAKGIAASSVDSSAPGSAQIEARFEDAALNLVSAGATVQNASSELARISEGKMGAKSLVVAMSGGATDVSGDGLRMSLSDLVVRSPANAGELLRLGSTTMAGGMLRSSDRTITLESVALADGKTHAALDAQGKLNWLSLFADAPLQTGDTTSGASQSPVLTSASTETAAAEAAPKPASTPPWRFALKSARVDRFAVGFEDERVSPAFAVGIEAIRAGIAGLDSASANPMQIEFQAKLASGGELQASGDIRPDNWASDLKIVIARVALSPVQSYLSEFAELRLASGAVSSAGRLRYNSEAGAGPKLAYEGSIAVDQVLLEESEPKRPFFSWDLVASDQVVLTLAPNRLEIGELKIERPSGRLIIAEDQSVNLMDVLKKPRQGDGSRKEAMPPSAGQGEARDEPFPVVVERVRVAGGILEFADLSLRPQFGTRMHELKGVITGLATDPNRSAQLQLDARVDRYGTAKIRGQISVRQPEKFTEIGMAFRNLEMTSLSPYVAKFAGYKISAGRLALDLQYRVRNSKLLGQNKIVLKQVELGEKVDSPSAIELPLELAIAILKDADGVIDIGLPVSGDLSDPKFDYGEIVGKAFGNLLGGIVSAPFRALGAMFGGAEKRLGSIDFEPGSDALAPPERQKLEAVARALKGRPALKLVVPPTFATEEDTPALKLLAVRSDIAKRMGIKLEPDEDPGPIDAANPRAQRAIEAAFLERYAPDLLALLKRRAVEGAAGEGESPAQGGKPAHAPAPSTPGAPQASTQAPAPPPAFYQSLVDRLVHETSISEEALAQLAARRGEAIVRELTRASGIPPARVVVGEARKATDATGEAVTLRLELAVAE